MIDTKAPASGEAGKVNVTAPSVVLIKYPLPASAVKLEVLILESQDTPAPPLAAFANPDDFPVLSYNIPLIFYVWIILFDLNSLQ